MLSIMLPEANEFCMFATICLYSVQCSVDTTYLALLCVFSICSGHSTSQYK